MFRGYLFVSWLLIPGNSLYQQAHVGLVRLCLRVTLDSNSSLSESHFPLLQVMSNRYGSFLALGQENVWILPAQASI